MKPFGFSGVIPNMNHPHAKRMARALEIAFGDLHNFASRYTRGKFSVI